MGNKNVKIKYIFIDHEKYLGKSKNPVKIYDHIPKNLFLSPFNLVFDTIDRLLVVNFEDDPIYFRIELQICHKNEKDYPLAIMYRKDDLKDIYYTNEIAIKDRKNIISNSLKEVSFNQLEVIEYKFQYDEMGLDAYLLFKDKLEKEIEFKIKENTPRSKIAKIEFKSISAPIGAITKRIEYFPIVFLDKFGMVLRKETEIYVKVHGFLRNILEMPFQINGMNFYQAHYSLDPIICNWNYNLNGNIDPIILNPPALNLTYKNLTFSLFRNSDYYEIKKFSGKDEKEHSISFEFSPPIPNLLFIRNNSKKKGKFSCTIDERKVIFVGVYNLARTGEIIEFSITPTKGWQPLWVKTYKWSAEIHIQNNGNLKIRSDWRRIRE